MHACMLHVWFSEHLGFYFFCFGENLKTEAPRNDLGHAAATSTRRSASGCGCALVEASRSSLEGAVCGWM